MVMQEKRKPRKSVKSGFVTKESILWSYGNTDWFYYNGKWIIAYLATARKMLVCIYYMLKKKEVYNPR